MDAARSAAAYDTGPDPRQLTPPRCGRAAGSAAGVGQLRQVLDGGRDHPDGLSSPVVGRENGADQALTRLRVLDTSVCSAWSSRLRHVLAAETWAT